MRALLLAAALAFAGCTEPPRQALVDLRVESPLLEVLTTVRVAALDEEGGTRGAEATLDLSAPYVRESRVSFGAVPSRDGKLALRFRGLDAAGAVRLEQTERATTQRSGVTPLSMTLRAECLDQPCDALPSSDCASPPEAGENCDAGVPVATQPDGSACLLGTILDCGECGRDCNMSNVSVASCPMGECVGTCETGFGDCDRDLRNTGCESKLSSDPKHCGECGVQCPYGICSAGACTVRCLGRYLPSDAARIVVPERNRLFGFAVSVREEGVLVGLGVNMRRTATDPDTKFRMALYGDDAAREQPSRLIDQAAQTSVYALDGAQTTALSICSETGLEMRVPNRVVLKPGRYWLFLFASGPLPLLAEPFSSPWLTSQEDVDYAGLERMPDSPSEYAPLKTSLQPALAAYVITAPVP